MKKKLDSNVYPKLCITKRGLTRHVNAKQVNAAEHHDKSDNLPAAKQSEEMHLPPLLEKFLRKGVTKLTKDECYSGGHENGILII